MNTLEVYDMAIGIERRLSNMYHRFSTLFKENPEIHHFWTGVANHEKGHSEVLTLSKGYLMWNHPHLIKHKRAPLIQRTDVRELESIEGMLREFERKGKKERISLQEALGILLRIENSELNHLYNRLVHLSGLKLSEKPENVCHSIFEHMKVIKAFMDKHYRGNLPAIRIEEYADTASFPPPPATLGIIRGKIVEIVSGMSYGFIEGADGKRYLFLPEDISQLEWKDVEIHKAVEFSVMRLPWGPRAKNVVLK